MCGFSLELSVVGQCLGAWASGGNYFVVLARLSTSVLGRSPTTVYSVWPRDSVRILPPSARKPRRGAGLWAFPPRPWHGPTVEREFSPVALVFGVFFGDVFVRTHVHAFILIDIVLGITPCLVLARWGVGVLGCGQRPWHQSGGLIELVGVHLTAVQAWSAVIWPHLPCPFRGH